jgi:mannose-6-phosphate isomerase-like protein (cupin superfamily)
MREIQMVEVASIKEFSDRLKPITNRGPHTTESEVSDAFGSLGQGDFRDASIYFGSFDGNAGWERHLAGDELVHVIAGSSEFDIIVDNEIEILALSAGDVVVVPKTCWHRFRSKDGVTVMTATPKGEEPHRFVDDPREL